MTTTRLDDSSTAPHFEARDAALSVWQSSWRIGLASLVLLAFCGFALQGVIHLFTDDSTTALARWVLAIAGAVSATWYLVNLWHAYRYEPAPPLPSWQLPRITVIVPAYNEGAAVRLALESTLHGAYPAERVQLIAIDDGSKDDTWSHIRAVAEAYPGRVTALQQPQNQGKKAALQRGFALATGDIVVTVDSDSKLDPNALRAIVAPFADPKIGAVAGRVTVINRTANWLTRLLSARFYITFDLARAAQSRFGVVLCTPGALSAYRRAAVMPVLPDWMAQTFLGQPCSIAEDRALTTWLLRAGHRAVYQRTAVVETEMPTALPRLFRMLLRWERGNIREGLVLLPELLGGRAVTGTSRLWTLSDVAIELLQHPVAWLGLAILVQQLWCAPASLLTAALFVLFGAVVQALYALRSPRASDFAYAVGYALFYFSALQWVFPYSLLTVRDSRWLTR